MVTMSENDMLTVTLSENDMLMISLSENDLLMVALSENDTLIVTLSENAMLEVTDWKWSCAVDNAEWKWHVECFLYSKGNVFIVLLAKSKRVL